LRYTKVYLLRSKDEVEEMFLKYTAEVENQLDCMIKRLRSDRSGEYCTIFSKNFVRRMELSMRLVLNKMA